MLSIGFRNRRSSAGRPDKSQLSPLFRQAPIAYLRRWPRRTFATRGQQTRNAPQPSRKPVNPPQPPRTSNFLQRISLPNTWRGRRAARQAKDYWIESNKEFNGEEPPQDCPGWTKPLPLFIDLKPATPNTLIGLDSIVFHPDNEFGQKLLRIANPIPWSKRSRWIRWPAYGVAGLYSSLVLTWIYCRETVPITGRSQFRCVPTANPPLKEESHEWTADADLREYLLPDGDNRVIQAQRLLHKVLATSGLGKYRWNLCVVNVPDTYNAMVQSNGFVVMYSGIFEVAQTDDEVAAVLSHEVAHVLAKHSSADLSGIMLGGLATTPAIPFILGAYIIGELILVAAPPLIVGSLVLLYCSRGREAEADKMGMLLMTEAGYSPHAAVSFWEKMTQLEQRMSEEQKVRLAKLEPKERRKVRVKPPEAEFNSTHPHSASRIKSAARDLPNILYITGKEPLPANLSSRQLQKLKQEKERWVEFLHSRPS
ncbi:MAG: hypothetical protein Q9213_007091 [Squamulea squamosa]